MPEYDWSVEKNDWLKENRHISFEEILEAIRKNDIIAITNHPNHKKYPNQKVYFVTIRTYIYVVPYVQNREKIFLKTIYPSRKATKTYYKKEQKKKV